MCDYVAFTYANGGVAMNTKKSVFLSHSSKDKFFVRELAERLRNNGVNAWIDEAEISIGDSLTEKIGSAIQDADFVCVVLSYNSINSNWVQKELQVALNKEFSEKEVVVLPVLLEPVKMPPFLADKLYADFSSPEKYEKDFPQLLKALGIEVSKAKEIEKNKQKEHTKKEVISFDISNAGKIFNFDNIETRNATITGTELENYEDVKIIGLDEDKSYRPDNNKELYNIYLTLSAIPKSEWAQIFEAERRFPRHSMWRKAWIQGKYIIVHCVPHEMEKYHLADLKEDVVSANQKYRQYLTDQIKREFKKLQSENAEKQDIHNLKNRLNFD